MRQRLAGLCAGGFNIAIGVIANVEQLRLQVGHHRLDLRFLLGGQVELSDGGLHAFDDLRGRTLLASSAALPTGIGLRLLVGVAIGLSRFTLRTGGVELFGELGLLFVV